MRTVGVRRLKEQIGIILRRVYEDGETVAITRHGRVVAHLVPARLPASPADLSALWTDLDALAAEIGARWPQGQTAVEAIREGRRDL
ncbi:MAG: type II toxin-antitoxin system Phd/YefM family antitoxin [Anaerolineae bacterium]|nr:type II toxin-antitoxin system Phd/YefM family antitoxin [Anaerolineae bacterium]